MPRIAAPFASLGALCALALTSGCNRGNTPPPPMVTQPDTASRPESSPTPTAVDPVTTAPAPAAAPEHTAAAAQGVNALGAELYARLKSARGNLVFSPASIGIAFGMTAHGARGATADEMRRVLHHTLPPDAFGAALGTLSREWNSTANAEIEIHTANRLYGQRSWPFERAYLEFTGTQFGAPLELVDFGTPEPVRQQINGWVLQQTRERIRDLIPPRTLTSDTRLVLVNAMYFKGAWADQFQPAATQPAPFQVDGTTAVPVPTMRRTGHYRYAARNGFRVLEMPYRDGRYAMDIVLPDRADGLAAVEAQLNGGNASAWFADLQHQNVALMLPRFRIESPMITLRQHLEPMGMRLAFDGSQADFTGIAPFSNPADRLCIGDGYHKAFIEVNEQGTEAAAATAVVMMRVGSAPSRPTEFRVDRPFLFALRDTQSGAVLFLGRVTDPR